LKLLDLEFANSILLTEGSRSFPGTITSK
jgi:hypothetical protein